MQEIDIEQETADIAREVIQKIAPEEVELFSFISKEFFENPVNFYRPMAKGEETLGGGLEEVVVPMTSIILPIVSSALMLFFEECIKTTAQETTRTFLNKIKNSIPHKTAKKEKKTYELDENKVGRLEDIREVIYTKALELKLDQKFANELADSIVACIVNRIENVGVKT
jgi:hypothetical protein